MKYFIYLFMTVVLSASAYQVLSGYFGAGRTGNYLKIRRKKDNRTAYCYRILPVYKLILRRMGILYSLMLALHIFLPLFYALIFSVLLALSDNINWWSTDKKGLKESVYIMWQDAGYSTWIFLLMILLSELFLVLINILVFPLVFEIAVKIFHG